MKHENNQENCEKRNARRLTLSDFKTPFKGTKIFLLKLERKYRDIGGIEWSPEITQTSEEIQFATNVMKIRGT